MRRAYKYRLIDSYIVLIVEINKIRRNQNETVKCWSLPSFRRPVQCTALVAEFSLSKFYAIVNQK